jgi:positive control factor
MISEMQFAIQWMVSGRNPEARRGADRTGTYTLDPKLIEAFVTKLLGITKSYVQTYLERAERKIENQKRRSLFLVS